LQVRAPPGILIKPYQIRSSDKAFFFEFVGVVGISQDFTEL